MKLLKTISLGQLDTNIHILTEMERMGVSSLAEARVILARETEGRHKARKHLAIKNSVRRTVAPSVTYGPVEKPKSFQRCPTEGCNGILRPDRNGDIFECRVCWYSELNELREVK